MDPIKIIESFYSKHPTRRILRPKEDVVAEVKPEAPEKEKEIEATELYTPPLNEPLTLSESWDDAGYRDRLLDAQLQFESNMDPNAVSHAGAQGLAQFMPNSWKDAVNRGWVDEGASPFNPDAAVKAQYGYMNRAFTLPQVKSAANSRDMVRRALASYNTGEGNLLKAINLARDRGTDWEYEIEALQKARSKNNRSETIDYMNRITGLVDKTMQDPYYKSKFDRTHF